MSIFNDPLARFILIVAHISLRFLGAPLRAPSWEEKQMNVQWLNTCMTLSKLYLGN